ncbi:TolC family protein [Novipirellula sp.]|uniref:TolC family protein n=1 Tax=Novipirellula sp. TaxID=2795430 RepID=UPI003563E380
MFRGRLFLSLGPVLAAVALATFAAVASIAKAEQPHKNMPSGAHASGNHVSGVAASGDSSSRAAVSTAASDPHDFQWWNASIAGPIMPQPHWVSFDLNTVLLDTLTHSPRIKSVSSRTSVALEKVTQQDAAFDSKILLESNAGMTNDPVGNTLTTGGPSRLQQDTFGVSAGVARTTRGGSTWDLSQELGTLNSNSLFFDPKHQGNSRLSLSLTRPLLARGGQVYTERLLTQAQIDAGVSWQEMRRQVEKRIADVMTAYWQLYEARCHFLQQQKLLERGQEIERIIVGRADFDSSRIELAKVRGRLARRMDQIIAAEANVRRQQARLAMLIGRPELVSAENALEMIPLDPPLAASLQWTLRDAVIQGLENRPEVRAAAKELESAALSMRITRNQLLPELNAVFDAYLAALNGHNDVFHSFGNQFTEGGPGLSAALQYEMPQGNRYARARHREAIHWYRQKSEELRETMQVTRAEIETALIDVDTSIAQHQSKRQTVLATTDEETVLTERYRMFGGDGTRVGVVLENLLDAQQRRSDAEREWVSTQVNYLVSLIELERAMGNLLIHENIETLRVPGRTDIDIVRSSNNDTAASIPRGEFGSFQHRSGDAAANMLNSSPDDVTDDTPDSVAPNNAIDDASKERFLPWAKPTTATPNGLPPAVEIRVTSPATPRPTRLGLGTRDSGLIETIDHRGP